MKILFLINNLSRGGAEGVFAAEAEALSRLGYDAQIFELYPYNFKNIYDWRGYRALIKKIRNEKIDVVYSTLDDANFVAKICRIFAKFRLFCRDCTREQVCKSCSDFPPRMEKRNALTAGQWGNWSFATQGEGHVSCLYVQIRKGVETINPRDIRDSF